MVGVYVSRGLTRGGMPMIVVAHDGERVRVTCPYDSEFPSLARSFGGRWERGVWLFPSPLPSPVIDTLNKLYGYVPEGKTSKQFIVTAPETIYSPHGPVRWNGRPLAISFGRDDSACTGPSVMLLSGEIFCDRRRSKWRTAVSAGARFRVFNCLFVPDRDGFDFIEETLPLPFP